MSYKHQGVLHCSLNPSTPSGVRRFSWVLRAASVKFSCLVIGTHVFRRHLFLVLPLFRTLWLLSFPVLNLDVLGRWLGRAATEN